MLRATNGTDIHEKPTRAGGTCRNAGGADLEIGVCSEVSYLCGNPVNMCDNVSF